MPGEPMSDLLGAMFAVLAGWCVVLVLLAGAGALVRRALGLEVKSREEWLRCFWLGLAASFLLLQLWHLWRPVDDGARGLLAVLGASGLVWNRHGLRRAVTERCAFGWAWLVALAVSGVYLANHAVDAVRNYDTGLYHLPSVRWAALHSIVPGLGNLHDLLGYNSSFFLYAALFEGGPWTFGSQHLANGVLLWALVGQLVASGFALFAVRDSSNPRGITRELFQVLLLVPATRMLRETSSLSPDLAFLVFAIVLHVELLRLTERGRPREEIDYSFFLLVVFAAGGTAAKVNFLVLVVVAVPLGLVAWWRGRRAGLPSRLLPVLAWTGVIAGSLLCSWLARGVILSGYPVYPSTAIAVPVDWRVSREDAESNRLWVQSWARQPGAPASEVMNSWRWLRPWSSQLIRTPASVVALTVPAGMAAAALAFVLASAVRRRSLRHGIATPWLLPAPAALYLLVWFTTAPDPRYAIAGAWICGAAALVLAVRQLPSSRIVRAARGLGVLSAAAALSSLLVFGLRLASPYESPFLVGAGPRHGFHDPPAPHLKRFVTATGLSLHVPDGSDQCWGAELPCTCTPRRALRLRRDGEVGSGFRIDEKR